LTHANSGSHREAIEIITLRINDSSKAGDRISVRVQERSDRTGLNVWASAINLTQDAAEVFAGWATESSSKVHSNNVEKGKHCGSRAGTGTDKVRIPRLIHVIVWLKGSDPNFLNSDNVEVERFLCVGNGKS
jgi:hypothetical protein